MPTIDELLATTDPGASTPTFTADQRRTILSTAVAPPKNARPRYWRFGAVAAVTVLVATLGVSNYAGQSASARADEVLTEAAINAVDPPISPGQFWRVSKLGTAGDPNGPCLERFQEDSYLAVDGNKPTLYVSRNLSDRCPGAGPVNEDMWAWMFSRSPNALADNWTWPSVDFLASLPRDVDQLRELMYRDSEGIADTRELGVYALAMEALESGIAPADLRSALFEVLKSVPGLVVVENTTVEGRDVVVFAVEVEGQEGLSQTFIDPKVGEVVGFRAKLADDNVRTSVNQRTVVDSIPEDLLEEAEVKDCTIDPSKRAEIGTDGQLVCPG